MPDRPITPDALAVAALELLEEAEVLSADVDVEAIMREGREHPLPESHARSLYSKVLGKIRGVDPADPAVAATVDGILAEQRASGIIRPDEEGSPS